MSNAGIICLKLHSSELVALSSPQYIATPQQNGAATLTRERELSDGPATGIRMLLEL
jgi:hypothetical protein